MALLHPIYNWIGRTDGWTDGPTDRPTDRPTDLIIGLACLAPTLPRPHRMSDDDGDFHSPLPSSDSRATSPSSRSEWESRSDATTEDARSNGNQSQDNFSHVDYEHQSDDSAAEGDPWWTDWHEGTLQELFETSLRESVEFRAASEAGSTSSESVEDAADAMQPLSMTVPLWAPIVQMPEIPEDQQHTRDAASHCKICGPDLFYVCLHMGLPSECPFRKRW